MLYPYRDLTITSKVQECCGREFAGKLGECDYTCYWHGSATLPNNSMPFYDTGKGSHWLRCQCRLSLIVEWSGSDCNSWGFHIKGYDCNSPPPPPKKKGGGVINPSSRHQPLSLRWRDLHVIRKYFWNKLRKHRTISSDCLMPCLMDREMNNGHSGAHFEPWFINCIWCTFVKLLCRNSKKKGVKYR